MFEALAPAVPNVGDKAIASGMIESGSSGIRGVVSYFERYRQDFIRVHFTTTDVMSPTFAYANDGGTLNYHARFAW